MHKFALYILIFFIASAAQQHEKRGYPTCYAICKTGVYALTIFIACQVMACSMHAYYFMQDLQKSNLISKPKKVSIAVWQLMQDIYRMPSNTINLCGIYALLYGGMYLSDPYEIKSNKI